LSQKVELKLDWCSYAAAKYAVEQWHYAKTMPLPPLITIGVWEQGKFIGCLCFSRGASPHLGKAYHLAMTEVCELTRVALSYHSTPVSRLLSIAVRLLKGYQVGLRLIVSFADPNEGHHGGIYQASGWLYVGSTAHKYDYIAPTGKRYRDRQVTRSGVARQFGKYTHVLRPQECQRILLQPKHRYLYPLDRDLREKLLPLAKPYPKRAASIAPDAPSHQGGEDGRQPIAALQPEGRPHDS
jgi:hypothetical protein